MNPVTTPLFASPQIMAETAADGSVLLRSADPLGSYPPTVMHSLRAWAEVDPEHPLAADRVLLRPGGIRARLAW